MALLPTQNKIPILEFKCKLPQDLIADVEAYATAIDSDISYVVGRAIERLTADKDFLTWKAANQEKLTSIPNKSSKQKPGPKPKIDAPPIHHANSGKAVA